MGRAESPYWQANEIRGSFVDGVTLPCGDKQGRAEPGVGAIASVGAVVVKR